MTPIQSIPEEMRERYPDPKQEDTQALLAQAEEKRQRLFDEMADERDVALEQVKSLQPSQAKDKAVSDLTAACYQKASQLKFSREEIEALKADFADDCFQPGAAGKESLIYIEHAALRERLDNVIGMGQWVMIPIRRWVEDFTYEKEIWLNNRKTGATETVKGAHVYVDCIMVIRGCFVASAIGEMTYYPDNHTQNYGDAVEGAETAALRRCCKRLGIGLQAWRKDWCLGWWERKREQERGPKPPPVRTEAAKPPAPKPFSPPPTKKLDPNDPRAIDVARLKALKNMFGAPGQPNEAHVHDWLVSKGWILPTESNIDWAAEHVPLTKEVFQVLFDEVSAFPIDDLPFNK